jgi:hypothetical protein
VAIEQTAELPKTLTLFQQLESHCKGCEEYLFLGLNRVRLRVLERCHWLPSLDARVSFHILFGDLLAARSKQDDATKEGSQINLNLRKSAEEVKLLKVKECAALNP